MQKKYIEPQDESKAWVATWGKDANTKQFVIADTLEEIYEALLAMFPEEETLAWNFKS